MWEQRGYSPFAIDLEPHAERRQNHILPGDLVRQAAAGASARAWSASLLGEDAPKRRALPSGSQILPGHDVPRGPLEPIMPIFCLDMTSPVNPLGPPCPYSAWT